MNCIPVDQAADDRLLNRACHDITLKIDRGSRSAHFQQGTGHVIGAGHDDQAFEAVFFCPDGCLGCIGYCVQGFPVQINAAADDVFVDIKSRKEGAVGVFIVDTGNQQFFFLCPLSAARLPVPVVPRHP